MQNGCEAPPRHRLRSGVEGLGSRWRHFVWRLLNYGEGRHGWQSWAISPRVPAWSHFHNSSLPKISGHNVNTASNSASVAANRTSTASCFLQWLLLSIGSQYRGSVQKQLETANGVYFQENRTLWRCLDPWLTCPSVASETPQAPVIAPAVPPLPPQASALVCRLQHKV